MNFHCTDQHSRGGVILLVLFALVFTPFVSAGTPITGFSAQNLSAKIEHNGKCDKMQASERAQLQQAISNCCDQNSDCKTHCQNLLLSHLPVSALLEPSPLQPLSVRSAQLSSSQILKGVFPPQDPRPPQT